MAGILLNDRNGNPVTVETVALPDGNSAFVQTLGDAAGNKFLAAPGGVGLPVQSEGLKLAYHYAVLGFSPVATPTDIIEIQGSATKTVRLREIRIDGVATAAGNMPVQLLRRSAADTTSLVRTAIVAFKPDLGAAGATPAASAVVSSIGTANPGVLGTQVGGVGASGRIQLSAAGSGNGAQRLHWRFDVNACVLRGIADFLYLNMNGAALPAGALFDITLVTQEDLS